MKILLKSTETFTTNDYPYGRLRATATFGTEYKEGKGFRTTFQTIDPKSGRVNAVKKSTYYPIIVLQVEDGFADYVHIGMNGGAEINKACKFMAENFHLFTEEQVKGIFAKVSAMLKIEVYSYVNWTGADKDAVLPLILPHYKTALHGFKTGENVFSSIALDIEALEATKQPDYSPFKQVA